MTYAKRQKAHWNVGKGEKGNRKAKEKQYSEDEIEEQLASEDPSFRYHFARRKKNMKAHLEYTVTWYKQRLESYEKHDKQSSFTSYLRTALKQAEKKLADFEK